MKDMPDATTVAAVSYRPLEAPQELAGIGTPEGVDERYFEITSLDGRTGLARHLVPAELDASAPLVLSVHGSGSSVAGEPNRALSNGLAARGVPVLAINTRQTGDAVNTDNFYATVRDIEAAYWVARDLGYRRIALHGHSLGTLQVSFFASAHWRPEFRGVILTGMPADLPWKSRHLLIGDRELYESLRAEAIEAVQAGDLQRVLSHGMPWIASPSAPVTAEHFLTYRTEGIAGPRSVDWVRRVPYPVLLLRDTHDTVVLDFEANWMVNAANEGIAPSVAYHRLESEPGSNGHGFQTSHEALVRVVGEWLATLES